MKKIVLILLVFSLNILFFQNFTTVSSEDRASWGSEISDTDDSSSHDDFQSALQQANSEAHNTRKELAQEFVEEKDVQDDPELTSLLED
jgi:hypothetical protein